MTAAAAALLDDPGVCHAVDTLGCGALPSVSGEHWLRAIWRPDALTAGASRPIWPERDDWPQATVLAVKMRKRTLSEAVQAWNRLAVDGRLLLCGGNDVGIKATAKQLDKLLGVAGEVVANRSRARVVGWTRSDRDAVALPEDPSPIDLGAFQLRSVHGANEPVDVDEAMGKEMVFHHRITGDLVDFGLGEGYVIYVFVAKDGDGGCICWQRSGGGDEVTYSLWGDGREDPHAGGSLL